jgi:hypothetical protein
MFETHRQELLQTLDEAHAAYYQAALFGGPSLYFHVRALEAGKEGNFSQFSESVYALLAAWGMHRMGRGGSKMRAFEEFRASLKPLWTTVLSLQQATYNDLDETAWQDLSKVFCGIRCMATGTSLVGNSKVMAHALPNLVPPVDREYTLRFLFGSGNITNNLESEWKKLQMILRHFFYPVVQSKPFILRAGAWMQKIDRFRWDTSPLKIADNLVIGVMRNKQAPTRVSQPRKATKTPRVLRATRQEIKNG